MALLKLLLNSVFFFGVILVVGTGQSHDDIREFTRKITCKRAIESLTMNISTNYLESQHIAL